MANRRLRLEQFILESIRLDALLDARARDIEFIKGGGEVLYTPDSSTWYSFFFPVSDGQEHSDETTRKSIPGFSEVYVESDRAEATHFDGSPLTGKQVTGMLGKILMDAIFAPQNQTGLAPEFFLTEESKQGLNEAIKTVLMRKQEASSKRREKIAIQNVLSALQSDFSSAGDTEKIQSLFLVTPNKLNRAGALHAFLDDYNLVNLIDRIKIYGDISFFDWQFVKSTVIQEGSGDALFQLEKSDIREFNRLKTEFMRTFINVLPETSGSKIASMCEILALNCILRDTGKTKTKIIYLTNSQWAIHDFDKFIWDECSDLPLRLGNDNEALQTVSSLFIRNPLCFLHDIELRPEDGEARGALKVFMDSIIPRKLHDNARLDTSEKKRSLINQAIIALEEKGKLDAYLSELDKFYQQWTSKKVPWVNAFLAQRAQHWAEGLQLFSEEGLYSFWRKVNRDFTRLSWQFGIYLALMTEGRPARAAPLIFIDCDTNTNQMLSEMQSVLARHDIEAFRDRIDEFLTRPAEQQSEQRKEYFDALVNAVLFMFSSQFETSKMHAETACELAMKSTDQDVTGREAYYLRSHLVRVTAANHSELENARKLMLIARSKLKLDNSFLEDGTRISTIRFDLEDWSRRIVTALAHHFNSDKPCAFPAYYLIEYLAFVRQSTSTNFNDLSASEHHALHRAIFERMKFNFLVIIVTMDEFNTQNDGTSPGFLHSAVSEWNRSYGSIHSDLKISVDEENLIRASTIEQAYLVALLAGAPGAEFNHRNLDTRAWVNQTLGPGNRSALKSAETSFIDRERYDRLWKYSNIRCDGSEAGK